VSVCGPPPPPPSAEKNKRIEERLFYMPAVPGVPCVFLTLQPCRYETHPTPFYPYVWWFMTVPSIPKSKGTVVRTVSTVIAGQVKHIRTTVEQP